MLDRFPMLEELAPIPEKCIGCGVQCELQAQIGELSVIKAGLNEIGENLVGANGATIDELLDMALPSEAADQAKTGIRKKVGTDLEQFDQKVDQKKQEIDANALSCNGILRMRASKDGVTYTVGVCTSQRVYVRGAEAKQIMAFVKAE